MRRWLWLCSPLIVALSVSGWASEAPPAMEGLGHLALRTVSPGHLLRPNVGYANTDPIPSGGTLIRSALTLGNVWLRREHTYLIDGEWLVADLTLTHALSDNFRLSAGFPIVGRFGGFGDGAIEWFHRTVGVGNADREKFPRNQFHLRMVGPNGRIVEDHEDSWGIGDIPFYGTVIIRPHRGSGPVLFANLGFTVPTGDEGRLEGLGRLLWGGSALAFQRLGRSAWVAYGGASFSYAQSRKLADIELRSEEFGFLAGLRFEISPRTALLVQYLGTSPVAHSYYSFSDFTHEVNAGVKHRISERLIVEAAVVENIFRFSNSADVGIHAAVAWLW